MNTNWAFIMCQNHVGFKVTQIPIWGSWPWEAHNPVGFQNIYWKLSLCQALSGANNYSGQRGRHRSCLKKLKSRRKGDLQAILTQFHNGLWDAVGRSTRDNLRLMGAEWGKYVGRVWTSPAQELKCISDLGILLSSVPAGLKWGLKFYISNKLPAVADTSGQWLSLWVLQGLVILGVGNKMRGWNLKMDCILSIMIFVYKIRSVYPKNMSMIGGFKKTNSY